MSGNENGNHNGITRTLVIVVASILSSLGAAGIIGSVIMYARIASLETSINAQTVVIQNLQARVVKIENDIYRPVFGKSSSKPGSYATKLPRPTTVLRLPANPSSLVADPTPEVPRAQ